MWVRASLILGFAFLCRAQTDLVGFNPEANLRLDANAEAVVFTSDGTKVVLATRTGAFLGDAQSGSLRPFATGSMRAVAISRDDKRMAAGGGAESFILP